MTNSQGGGNTFGGGERGETVGRNGGGKRKRDSDSVDDDRVPGSIINTTGRNV